MPNEVCYNSVIHAYGKSTKPEEAALWLSRMEAADHWIVYSEVRDGKVFKDEKTATHHRKVASYY